MGLCRSSFQSLVCQPKDWHFSLDSVLLSGCLTPHIMITGGRVMYFKILNSQNEKGILSFTTRLRDSAFKKSIVGFHVGTEVEVGSIGGNFVLPEDNSKPLVFTAEG